MAGIAGRYGDGFNTQAMHPNLAELARVTHAGAVLAAVRALAPQLAGRRVGVIVSGGNVDLDRFAALLVGGPGDPL